MTHWGLLNGQGELQTVEHFDSRTIRGTLKALQQYNAALNATLYDTFADNSHSQKPFVSDGSFLPLQPVVVIQTIRTNPISFDFNLNWTLVVTCPMYDAEREVHSLMAAQSVLVLMMLATFGWLLRMFHRHNQEGLTQPVAPVTDSIDSQLWELSDVALSDNQMTTQTRMQRSQSTQNNGKVEDIDDLEAAMICEMEHEHCRQLSGVKLNANRMTAQTGMQRSHSTLCNGDVEDVVSNSTLSTLSNSPDTVIACGLDQGSDEVQLPVENQMESSLCALTSLDRANSTLDQHNGTAELHDWMQRTPSTSSNESIGETGVQRVHKRTLSDGVMQLVNACGNVAAYETIVGESGSVLRNCVRGEMLQLAGAQAKEDEEPERTQTAEDVMQPEPTQGYLQWMQMQDVSNVATGIPSVRQMDVATFGCEPDDLPDIEPELTRADSSSQFEEVRSWLHGSCVTTLVCPPCTFEPCCALLVIRIGVTRWMSV